MTPAELCRAIVDAYAASYRPSDAVALSVEEIDKATDVATAVDALARALIAAIDDHGSLAKLAAVRARVQSYTPPYDECIDLVDLCDGLQHMLPQQPIPTASEAVKNAVRTMILDSKTKGNGVARSRGVSIYFPSRKGEPALSDARLREAQCVAALHRGVYGEGGARRMAVT